MVFFDPTRASTLLLTALMVIGLGFFIRASTKDRIEVMQFGSTQAAEPLRKEVTNYFQTRAYRQIAAPVSDVKTEATPVREADLATITVAGMVSPSIFMAVFLSGLAAVGFACLALIMATLFPGWGRFLFALVLLSPLAGLFYWRKSSRPEKVTFKVEALDATSDATSQPTLGQTPDNIISKLTVEGHRDELAAMKNAFSPVLRALS